ncbi:MAG: 3-deoxy-8-phosphooctulonate synthase [Chlamydiota bacterium]|nr:3-deoxy-8-phosphooctulonate synthase [Chlamydiota bacterium]
MAISSVRQINISDKVIIGGAKQLVFIAGPCVIESAEHVMMMAREIRKISNQRGISVVFKASFDKANRSSHESFRGPGLVEGLSILKAVKQETGLPILTDVHREQEIEAASEVADILQIPAFLCRQTDFIQAVAKKAKVINVKKGQFVSPWEMKNIAEKIKAVGMEEVLFTERGFCFGYQNLVADMRSLPIMRNIGYPVIFDATHSVQLPGAGVKQSSGQREFVFYLARAAVATGCDGVFLEVHDNPDHAPSDGANMLALSEFGPFIDQMLALDETLRRMGIK